MKKKQFLIVSRVTMTWKSKLLFTMRLTLLALLLPVFQSFAISGYAQNTRLTLKMENTSIKQVLNSIEEQTDFFFLYNSKLIDVEQKVSINAPDKNIRSVLDQLFTGTNIQYEILDRQILLSNKVILTDQPQRITVKGQVTGDNGAPLPGVTIVIKGTAQGTITDINGKYTLPSVSNDAVLTFSFVGMKTRDINVNGNSVINVTMQEEAIGLEEVVAIGYGVVKKRDLTGSVSSVRADEIAKTTTSNAMQAMQARVPGLDIQQEDGQAGSGLSLTLRGKRSISAGNSPLILVDGVEYGSTLDINPSDIESMDILKDASSTAIYGTKGANGVILITTKRGKPGKMTVNFNMYMSSNQPTHVPQVMYGEREVQMLVDKANYAADAAEYAADLDKNLSHWGSNNKTVEDVLTLALDDGTTEYQIYQDGSYTNWADIILQNGLTQNYEVSVSGGSEKTNASISLGAMYEEGLMRKDEMDRYNARINVDHKVNDKLKVGSSILYTYKDHDARNSSVFSQSLKMTTITHAYLSDGSLNVTPNPRYAAHCSPLLDEIDGAYQNNTESSRIFGNTYAEIRPVKNLTLKSMFALDRSVSRQGIYQDYQSVARYQSPGTGYISLEHETTTKYTWDNTINYHARIGEKHDISALLGHSMTQSVYEESITSGDCGKEHYYQSGFYDLSKISSSTSESDYIKSSMVSFFSRVNYSYADKYLFQASVRTDGSSTLADGHKWGYFPSVAASWRVSDESFMNNTGNWLDNLKLRASWGLSGNAAVDAYRTLTTLSSNLVYYYLDGDNISGNIPSQIGNQDLTWEKTSAYNFGVDFGLLNNRISGSIDYYISHTTDLLYTKSVPASSVYPTVIDNVGETKGHGLELSLSTLVAKSKDFSWNVDWSYSRPRDKVSVLSEGVERNISGTSGYIVGEPVSIFYDYKANGCWDVGEYETYVADWQERHPDETIGYVSAYGAPGTIKIIDRNDDGQLGDDDKFIYKNSPNHIFGMNNTFTFKDFSLSVLVYARLGGYIAYDMNKQLNFESANWGDLDYWTYSNTKAKFPNPGTASTTFGSYGSSLLYEKADYIKIKDITLSYNLPASVISKAKIDQVRVYGSLKNFLTFSKIDNYDPERGGSISFPLAKQLVIGVNLQF